MYVYTYIHKWFFLKGIHLVSQNPSLNYYYKYCTDVYINELL